MKLPVLSKRATYSLLYITEFNCYRLDTDKTGVVLGQIQSFDINCPNTGKLVDTLKDVVINKEKPLAKKTWILYDRLNINVITVPTMQIEGVEEDGLLPILQFELESLTGQSTTDMQLAYTLLGSADEMSSFWISQISVYHLEDLYKLLKKSGTQLQGILHPAGLNAFLENPKEMNWLRFECWSQQLVALRRTEHGLSIRLFRYDARQWQAQLDKWLATQPTTEHSEALFTGDIYILPDTNSQLFLRNDDSITQWLGLWWAVALVAKAPPAVPILRYKSTVNQDLLLMVSGGGIALLICAGHAGWHLYQTHHYDTESTQLKQLQSSISQANKSLTDNKTKKTKLEQDIKKLKTESEALPILVSSLQRRPVQLLEYLAKGRPENLLLETIEEDKGVIHLRGITLDAASSNNLASVLDEQLSKLGWLVAAPSKNNMAVFADGGPWEFEINLTDLGLDSFTKKDDTPKDDKNEKKT